MKPTKSSPNLRSAARILLKALVLLLIFNFLFIVAAPIPALGRISAYNHIFPGRLRLPYSDVPEKAYSLSLFNLDAMFASHELAGASKPEDEFRVILIGDSSAWGFLLPAEQTLTTQLNQMHLTTPDGKNVRFYNLGYPVMSLTKDLLILSYALQYDPDLIIWAVTLESFPYDKQLYPPLLQNNPAAVRQLIEMYHLNLNTNDPGLISPSFWERTLVGQRRSLADLIRLQLYGAMWSATGVDQYIPERYTPRQEDFEADESFHNLQPPHLKEADLAFDVLEAGMVMVGDVPILLINEPTFVSQGKNSQLRYNFFYPRWAYDDFRQMLAEKNLLQGWSYLDLWDAVGNSEFTNSAVHLTANGTAQLAERVAQEVEKMLPGEH
jgi:hypothetical protein